MNTHEIIAQLQELEKKVLEWKPVLNDTPNASVTYVGDFSVIQDQLDELLKVIQAKPQDIKDAVNPQLTRFQNSVQSHYTKMVQDVENLRANIDEMQMHSRAMWAYGNNKRKLK